MTKSHPLIEDILQLHTTALGSDYHKYRNHIYRVFNFTLLLAPAQDIDTLAVAAAFHDIGIWTAYTFDYLEPSATLAAQYIATKQPSLSSSLAENIIFNHHKITSYRENDLANAFRKADRADLSFGMIAPGMSRKEISEICEAFPALGFHWFILKEIIKNSIRHPLNPLPIMKW